MNNTEMPDEIYVQLGENRIGTEICLRKWSEKPFEDGTKYARAPIPAPVGDVDLDNAREVFEKWITANGDYPHLKHKSFGGNYLHEEVAMKWDGFRAGYYTQPKQSAPVERIDRLKEAVEFRREMAEFGIKRVDKFFGMNKDKPELSLDTILWIAANAYLKLQGGE